MTCPRTLNKITELATPTRRCMRKGPCIKRDNQVYPAGETSESEILGTWSSFGRWTGVDLASMIEDHDLVEKVVDTLSRF